MYLLSKDEVIEKFILYKNEIENHFNKKINMVQIDRDGEYVSPFTKFYVEHEIRHEITAFYTPQQSVLLKEIITF